MKLAIITAVAVLAVTGCASEFRKPDGTVITTPSIIYSAEQAAKAGLNQAQTNVCVAQGRERLLSVGVGGGMPAGGFGWLEGGKAFDACVAKPALEWPAQQRQ